MTEKVPNGIMEENEEDKFGIWKGDCMQQEDIIRKYFRRGLIKILNH